MFTQSGTQKGVGRRVGRRNEALPRGTGVKFANVLFEVGDER